LFKKRITPLQLYAFWLKNGKAVGQNIGQQAQQASSFEKKWAYVWKNRPFIPKFFPVSFLFPEK
jgi:hypothetical protein